MNKKGGLFRRLKHIVFVPNRLIPVSRFSALSQVERGKLVKNKTWDMYPIEFSAAEARHHDAEFVRIFIIVA